MSTVLLSADASIGEIIIGIVAIVCFFYFFIMFFSWVSKKTNTNIKIGHTGSTITPKSFDSFKSDFNKVKDVASSVKDKVMKKSDLDNSAKKIETLSNLDLLKRRGVIDETEYELMKKQILKG